MKKKLKLKNKFIPVNTPKIFKEDKINVNTFLNTGWVSSEGSFVKKFENDFAKFNKRKYGVAVSSGTSALEIALKSLNIKKNSEVIIPAFTIISSALSVIKSGCKPVLVDCDLFEWNTPIDEIKKKITKKTKAIVIVHLYGQSCEMKDLLYLAKKKGLPVIEDCSQSTGGKYKKRYLGSLGVFGCFSFFPTKNLSCIGDGGMITTNDSFYYKKINYLREYGWDENRNARLIGINSRLDEIQAAILNVKLKYLNKDNIERRSLANYYHNMANCYGMDGNANKM